MKTATPTALGRNPTQFARSLILQGVKDLYKKYSVAISPRKFGKSWSRMSLTELHTAFNYVQSIQQQSPRGAGWVTQQLSNRVVASTFEGSVWSVAIGFDSRSSALKFLAWVHQRNACVLATEPRKAKQTKCACEIKLWSPSIQLLEQLIERDAAA